MKHLQNSQKIYILIHLLKKMPPVRNILYKKKMVVVEEKEKEDDRINTFLFEFVLCNLYQFGGEKRANKCKNMYDNNNNQGSMRQVIN